jgi:hypothetical protein
VCLCVFEMGRMQERICTQICTCLQVVAQLRKVAVNLQTVTDKRRQLAAEVSECVL